MENYDIEEPAIEVEDVFGGLSLSDVENGMADMNDLLIMPPRVLGYSTKEKIWGQFFVSSILPAEGKQPAKFRKDLQLDDKYKELIEALVESHEADVESTKPAPDLVHHLPLSGTSGTTRRCFGPSRAPSPA